jgi:MraZ protein
MWGRRGTGHARCGEGDALASFRGSFRHQIDAKGRLALPKPFRRITGVKEDGQEPVLVLTKGFNACVAAYTAEDWPVYERRLRDATFVDQGSRDFMLELAADTSDVPIDTVGRILIPQIHMEIGGFGRNEEILVLGMFDHIELWNVSRYEQHIERSSGTFEDRARGFFLGQR